MLAPHNAVLTHSRHQILLTVPGYNPETDHVIIGRPTVQRVDEHEPRRSVRAARLCADAVFLDNLEGVVPVKTGILGLVISELLLAQRHKVGCAESSRSFEPVVESEQQQARCSSFFTGVTTACGVKSTDEDTAFSIVFVVF